ncbi:MAG: hypothetical protein RI911_481 [Candidatus Parcubacteria bacterium]|jgi:hypothetical protein
MADEMGMQQPTSTEPAAEAPKYGVMIGAGLLLAIVVLGGLFMWGKSVTPQQPLNIEDAQPKFEVMTSHVEEPNLAPGEELPTIPESIDEVEQLDEDTFE